MTIDEAIKIKEIHQRLHPDEYYPELLEADKLSIEALKRTKAYRTQGFSRDTRLLPGETKE